MAAALPYSRALTARLFCPFKKPSSMPDQDTPASNIQSQIADAIRAKREGSSHKLIKDELEAMEALLLADLDSFDPAAVARQMDAETPRPRISQQRTSFDLNYPDINANAAGRPAATPAPTASPSKTNAPQPTPAPPKIAAPSLLDQLRQQAEATVHRQHTEDENLAKKQASLDIALRQVFSYLHELVQQLNVLKPAIPRRYHVAGSLELAGMVWQQGFADYRSRPESAGAQLESVSFNYQLRGGEGLVIERDGMVADNFRKFLFERNLNVVMEEFRNDRHYVEKARFTIAPEIKVNIRWEADARSGKLLVHTRNLERLGSATYQLAPETLNQSLLDEFGRLILDQPQHFTRRVGR